MDRSHRSVCAISPTAAGRIAAHSSSACWALRPSLPLARVKLSSSAEISYLYGARRLGRIATVGRDGTPHVVPVGWTHNSESDTIDVSGHDLAKTKKFRDVERTGRAAIVIDDLASTNPFRPRAIEVRGRAEAIAEPQAIIRVHPERIVSWGIEPQRNARTVKR